MRRASSSRHALHDCCFVARPASRVMCGSGNLFSLSIKASEMQDPVRIIQSKQPGSAAALLYNYNDVHHIPLTFDKGPRTVYKVHIRHTSK